MSKAAYRPRAEKDRLARFNNFSDRFSTCASGLGFTAANVASVASGAMFNSLITCVEIYTTAKEPCADYKNLMGKGPLGRPRAPTPSMGTMPTEIALTSQISHLTSKKPWNRH